MKKVALLFIFITALFSLTYPDFSKCYEKYHNRAGLIPVSKNYSITLNKPEKYVRYDSFRNLYLVKHKNRTFIKFKTYLKLGFWIASIGKDSIYVGNYAQKSKGMELSEISTKTSNSSIMVDIFCNPIGIGVGGTRFLNLKEIKYFLKGKKWGSLKVEFNKNLVVVRDNSNENSPFKIGDKVLFMNGKKVSIDELLKKVLYSKIGTKFKFKVLRNGKKIDLVAETFDVSAKLKLKKIPNYILESGLYLDENLNIKRVIPNSEAFKHYIPANGRVTHIDGIYVNSLREANKLIYKLKDVTITIKQNGLYFNLKYKFKLGK